MPIEIGRVEAYCCGGAVSIGRGVDIKIGSILAENCGIGVVIDGQMPNDFNAPGIIKDNSVVAPNTPTKWENTKRFLRDVSVGALSTAIVQGATTSSSAL